MALDPEPQGHGVTRGTHLDALPAVDMLIVWPPDWTDVYAWVRRSAPTWVFTVGQARFYTDRLAVRYAFDGAVWIEGGRKGSSQLMAWRRRVGA